MKAIYLAMTAVLLAGCNTVPKQATIQVRADTPLQDMPASVAKRCEPLPDVRITTVNGKEVVKGDAAMGDSGEMTTLYERCSALNDAKADYYAGQVKSRAGK